MTKFSQEPSLGRRTSSMLFGVTVMVTLGAFYWLFLDGLFVCKDVNMEAMDWPLATAHLELAREKRISPTDYFQSDPVCNNLKEENAKGAYAYFRNRFQFEFFAYMAPFVNFLYVPFIRLVGVSAKTIALYATFFSFLAWIATGMLAQKMFGRWCAVLAMLLLISSLSWLIHTKVGYAPHMPAACLMVLHVLCMFAYARRVTKDLVLRRRAAPLASAGCLFGLMYLVGWVTVAFGALMACLTLALSGPRRIGNALVDITLLFAAAVATVLLATSAYAAYYHCSFVEIHSTIRDLMFGRFSQGGVPTQEMTIAGKMAYAFRCTFWDMRTTDHLDKCLEGFPAIPPVFSALFGAGLLYAIKERTPADKTLLIWLVSVFGVLGSFFTFTHRYALMALPAMSLLAARGVAGMVRALYRWRGEMARLPLVAGVVLLLGLALIQTYRGFYVEYMLHKPPDFEVDRARGHASFANWLRQTGTPRDTLVVLGDPIMFPHTSFLFNTFGSNYRFVYWSNYFSAVSTSEEVGGWERRHLAQYRRVVFAFSLTLLGNPQTGTFNNDWHVFLTAHPGLRPVWSYAYAARPPAFLVYEITSRTIPAKE